MSKQHYGRPDATKRIVELRDDLDPQYVYQKLVRDDRFGLGPESTTAGPIRVYDDDKLVEYARTLPAPRWKRRQ